MATLARTLRWDLNVQARSFIYPATVVSTAMICGVILILPLDPLSPKLAAFFVFADPATIGLSFVGAMVLMEKTQGTIFAVGVTPMKPWIYVASKTVSLTLVTFASGLVVAWVATDGVFNVAGMMLMLALSSTLAVLIGFACVSRAPSMNKLMITLLWVTTVAYLALLSHFALIPEFLTPVIAIVPSYAMLVGLTWAVDGSSVSMASLVAAIGYLVLWCAFGWWWTMREYTRSIVTDGK